MFCLGSPAVAIHKVAERSGVDPLGWDLIEINEAYAATPLGSTLLLAGGDRAKAEKLRSRTNMHGGAVAIGHPLGASGARVVMTLINGLRKRAEDGGWLLSAEDSVRATPLSWKSRDVASQC